MAKIFISYRRDDSKWPTGRINDRLKDRFGAENVFMDVDNMPLGVDYREYLDGQIKTCDRVVVVIGHGWLGAEDKNGRPRLESPGDYVRTEIELALQRRVQVIPVLLDGVGMPAEKDLPPSISVLAYRHGQKLDTEGFDAQLDNLIRGLEQELGAGDSSIGSDPDERVADEDEVVQRLLAELENPETEPERRLKIGDRLAALGDPRPGVGLDANGLPDIDWIEVPEGDFLFGEKKEREFSPAFRIARYPVTNAQFQAFIDDGGYREDRWWKGLAERVEAPAYISWSQPNRPRETGSWYEAVAFCRWLSERRGEDIRLPTEIEWEKAARGTDGREYSWGDGFRSGWANLNEKGLKAHVGLGFLAKARPYLKQTTAVGVYPTGASPCGALDMAGNVWEWCLNEYDRPENTATEGAANRVLRGGSWIDLQGYARAVNRHNSHPDYRSDLNGFRVVCSSPISH